MMLSSSSRKNPFHHPVDYKSELELLFRRIEGDNSAVSPYVADDAVNVAGIGSISKTTLNIDAAASAKDFNQKGEELFARGDIDGAESAFREALKIDENFAEAYNNLGVVYCQRNELEQAIEYFGKSININPFDRTTVLNQAEVCDSLHRYDTAAVNSLSCSQTAVTASLSPSAKVE